MSSLIYGAMMSAVALLAAGPVAAQATSCRPAVDRMKTILGNDHISDTMVLAHRGFWGRHNENPNIPENSEAAIMAAGRGCADGVELDVKLSHDAVPILMHDFNLGRTTNVYQLMRGAKYDPIHHAGTNPLVSSLSGSTLAALHHLTPDRGFVLDTKIPSVERVLRDWIGGVYTNNPPIVFDIKTRDTVKAVDQLVGRWLDSYGKNVIAVKVNATLYPSPASFHQDASHMSVIPVFTTNMLGIMNVPHAVTEWALQVNTLEINMKQAGGLLSPEVASAKHSGNRIGVFHALPDGPYAGNFYRNDGSCCYKLSDLYYTYQHPQGGGSTKDTADHRGDLDYITQQGFKLVTTDDPNGTVKDLAAKGLRHTYPKSYF